MSGFTRRDLLKALGLGTGALAVNTMFPRFFVSDAHAAGQKKYLSIFQNGGHDQFAMLTRTGDSAFMTEYLKNRPTIGLELKDNNNVLRPRLQLNGNGVPYTVHNRMVESQRLFNVGQMAFFEKTGVIAGANGSHEEAQQYIKEGTSDGRIGRSSGILKRLGNDNFGSDPLKIIDRAGGTPATLGIGDYKPLSVGSLADLGFNATVNGETGFRLETAFALLNQQDYNAATRDFLDNYKSAQSNVDVIKTALTGATYAAAFPNTGIGNACKDAYNAFRFFNTTAVHIEAGGFDLHSGYDPMGQNVNTPMGESRLLKELDDALLALRLNLESIGEWQNTVVSVATEFGRTLVENATFGVDHALSFTAMVTGGSVVGGIYGDYVSADDLKNPRNGVPATTNMLDIYHKIFSHMGLNTSSILNPGYTPKNLTFL